MMNLIHRLESLQVSILNLSRTVLNQRQIIQSLIDSVSAISTELEEMKSERNKNQSQLKSVRGDYASHELVIKQLPHILKNEELRSFSSIRKAKHFFKQLNDSSLSSNANTIEFKPELQLQSQSLNHQKIILPTPNQSILSIILPNNSNDNTKIQQFPHLNDQIKPQQKSSSKFSPSSDNLTNTKDIKSQNHPVANSHTISTQQSSNQNISENDSNNEYFAEIQRFLCNIQRCDLIINEPIQYAYVLVGMKKTGLTSIGHLFSSTVLKGMKHKGQHVIDTVTSNHGKFIIGHQYHPQTETPNKFQVLFQQGGKSLFLKQKMETKKVSIIDPPGYCSYENGVLQIISDGYFNYRIFSKTRNIKFILCFDMTQFGKDTFKTIQKFIKTFKNFEEIKEQIFGSSCFLFNKVEEKKGKENKENSILEDIKQRLEVLMSTKFKNSTSEEDKNARDFVEQMIKNNIIFTIKSYKDGEQSNDFQLLTEVDKKVQWFSRGFNGQKRDEVDMSNIRFSITKDIAISTVANKLSQQKLEAFIKFQNRKIDSFFVPNKNQNQFHIQQVIQRLVNDAMGKLNQHGFINVLKNCHQKYGKFRLHLEQSQIEYNRLFELSNLESTNSSLKIKNFVVKKFKAIEKIYQLIGSLNRHSGDGISFIEDFQRGFVQIIKQLQIVSYKKENRKIIIRYGYEIFRLLQESKIFLLIMENLPSQNTYRTNNKSNPNNILINLLRPLKSFLTHSITHTGKKYSSVLDLQKVYVQNFNMEIEQNKNLDFSQDFVDFFINVNSINKSVVQKVVNILLKYAKKVLNNSENTKSNEVLFKLIPKLITGIRFCRNLWRIKSQQPKQNNVILMILKLGKSLGQALQILKKYSLSMEAYKSVLCIDSACRMYQLQIAELEKQQKSSIETRIDFVKYLVKNQRAQDGRKLVLKTYEMVESQEELNLIQSELYSFKDLLQLDEGMFDSEKFGNFSLNLKTI